MDSSRNLTEYTSLRHLPPTAVPVVGSDIWRGLAGVRDPKGSLESFRSALIEISGNSNCTLTTSGRSALTVILNALKRLSERKQVLLPAYSCPTVVQAVLKAGLIPVFCDVSPKTLDMDREALLEQLDRPLLAMIPTHLYGLAQDVSDLVKIGRERDIFIVEDAAQAFGAKIHGGMVGNAGDAGIYSLGRGKCLPTGHGGVIVSQDRYAPLISELLLKYNSGEIKREMSDLMGFIGYGLATTPVGWWFVVRSPLNPAKEGMDLEALPPVEIHGFSATQAAIGLSILKRIDTIQAVRRRNARRIMDLLSCYKFIILPLIPEESEPVFLRLPIVMDTPQRAERLYELLSKAGIGVSRSYYRTLPDMFSDQLRQDVSEHPGATHLAHCLLTLPTHHHLKEDDFIRMKNIFDTLARSDLNADTAA